MKLKHTFFILFLTCFLNLNANPWVQKADFGGPGRHRATGISIANKGYMGLGHINGTGIDINYKDWWQFDPASNSWSQKANFPLLIHGAVSFSSDTRGYVGGGSTLSNEFYEYNPVMNTWSPIAPCPITPGDSQGFSVQNKGYVYLGNQLAEFDPSTNSWSIKPTAPISFGTWSCSFGTESSGFVKSGIYLYEYKPASNEWIQRASFPGQMSNGSSAFSIENKGYVTCGYVGVLANVTDEVWEFNPGNNSWNFICNFPGTNRRFAVAFAINNKGYYGTGTNGINMNDFWQYYFDPLGIDQHDLDNVSVSVFPNPAVDNVNFHFNGIESFSGNEYSLTIHASDGRIISMQEINSTDLTIDRNAIQAGIYFYSIQYRNSTIRKGKIIYY
jgi:N-acetylneuraminic acid mutarotase